MCFDRMIRASLLVLVLVSPASSQVPIWTQLPNAPIVSRHDDVFPLNETTAWTASGRDGIYKTTDGGITWAKVLTNASTHFRCIGFASSTRGWAGNLGPDSYDSSAKDTNVLYETFDGGLHWSNRPGFAEAGMKGLCSIQVFDAQTIYGVGRVRGPAYFIKSLDGGATWSITNLTAAGVMGAMMDVYFRDKMNGFVVGMSNSTFADLCGSIYYGQIARTTNGGATWFPVASTSVQCCYFWKMSWPSPNIGYASLQKNPTSSDSIVFYKTTDGGVTWVSNGVPVSAIGLSSFYWQGIGFISPTEGWAGGDGSSSPYANNFLHTTDGGLTWTPAGYNDSRRINRIRVLSPTLAFASGAAVHVFRPPLLITNQPQSQWVSAGVNLILSVGVSGNPPVNYQWRKDGVNIAGATHATLGFTNVVRGNSGAYSVLVTNAWTSLLSSNATLRVVVPQYLKTPQLAGSGVVKILFGDADGGLLTSNDIANFQVQAASNLVDWVVLTNSLSLTNGLMLLQDSSAYTKRFYRVLEH
jgi:photosystem II stability/assembly factor-like uncharacterized protein